MFVEMAKMDDGEIYAVNRRCGHTNAPLEMGTLEGYILTCPLHFSQFDIMTGEVLSGSVPRDFGDEPFSEGVQRFFQYHFKELLHPEISRSLNR
jgi:nitrite reductase/ring-hydroxylating ferredoxin subunit